MMKYMTDDQVTPTVDPSLVADPNGSTSAAQTPPAGQADQDPLAILENILQDAKKKSEGKTTGAGGQPTPSVGGEGTPSGAGESTDPALEAQKQAALEAEAAHQEKYEAERQRQIAEQQALIKQQLPQTPQFQAWQQQRAEAEEEKAQASTAGDGYEIEQLTTTKIPVPDSQTALE